MSWAGPFQYDIGKSRNAQQVPAEVVFDDRVPTLLCLSHLRWSFVYQRPQPDVAFCPRLQRALP